MMNSIHPRIENRLLNNVFIIIYRTFTYSLHLINTNNICVVQCNTDIGRPRQNCNIINVISLRFGICLTGDFKMGSSTRGYNSHTSPLSLINIYFIFTPYIFIIFFICNIISIHHSLNIFIYNNSSLFSLMDIIYITLFISLLNFTIIITIIISIFIHFISFIIIPPLILLYIVLYTISFFFIFITNESILLIIINISYISICLIIINFINHIFFFLFMFISIISSSFNIKIITSFNNLFSYNSTRSVFIIFIIKYNFNIKYNFLFIIIYNIILYYIK